MSARMLEQLAGLDRQIEEQKDATFALERARNRLHAELVPLRLARARAICLNALRVHNRERQARRDALCARVAQLISEYRASHSRKWPPAKWVWLGLPTIDHQPPVSLRTTQRYLQKLRHALAK